MKPLLLRLFDSPGRECEVLRSRQSVGQARVGGHRKSLLAAWHCRHTHLTHLKCYSGQCAGGGGNRNKDTITGTQRQCRRNGEKQ